MGEVSFVRTINAHTNSEQWSIIFSGYRRPVSVKMLDKAYERLQALIALSKTIADASVVTIKTHVNKSLAFDPNVNLSKKFWCDDAPTSPIGISGSVSDQLERRILKSDVRAGKTLRVRETWPFDIMRFARPESDPPLAELTADELDATVDAAIEQQNCYLEEHRRGKIKPTATLPHDAKHASAHHVQQETTTRFIVT